MLSRPSVAVYEASKGKRNTCIDRLYSVGNPVRPVLVRVVHDGSDVFAGTTYLVEHEQRCFAVIQIESEALAEAVDRGRCVLEAGQAALAHFDH